jgi:hypothetical protein
MSANNQLQQLMLTRLGNLERKMECLFNPIEHMKYKIEYIRNNFSKEINDKFSHLKDDYKECNPMPDNNNVNGFVKTELYKKMLKHEIELAEKEERDRIDDEQLFHKYNNSNIRHKYSEELCKFNKELQEWTKLYRETVYEEKDKYILELVELYFGYDKIVNNPDFKRLVNL